MPFSLEKESREYFTDFVGGSVGVAAEPFVSTIANTGLQTQTTSVYPSNVGIQTLSAGTTSATGGVRLNLDDGSFLLGAAPHHFRTVFRIPTLATSGVVDFTIIMGFYNNTTGTDGCWFAITATNKVTLNYLDNNVGATALDLSGAIPALVAGTWYMAEIDVNVPIINSNQAASPNYGGPFTGARFYFGPQVPTQYGTQNWAKNAYLGSVPASKLPGYSDTRPVGVQVSLTGVTSTTAGRNIDIDKIYVREGLMGYV